VNEVSDFLEEAYQDLSAQFDVYPTSPFVVVLYPRQQFYKAADAPAWAGAANDGKIKLPVRGVTELNNEMKEALKHELIHSFVTFKTSENCPTWLQEGLAQDLQGKRLSKDETKALKTLAGANSLPHFTTLAGGFTAANTVTAVVLYMQSLSFSDYLIRRYKFYSMNALLDELGKGTSFNEAFESTYSIPLARAEQDWLQTLKEIQ
jgi:hypothetical protein